MRRWWRTPRTIEGWFACYAVYALSVPFFVHDRSTADALAMGPIGVLVFGFVAVTVFMGVAALFMCVLGRR